MKEKKEKKKNQFRNADGEKDEKEKKRNVTKVESLMTPQRREITKSVPFFQFHIKTFFKVYDFQDVIIYKKN